MSEPSVRPESSSESFLPRFSPKLDGNVTLPGIRHWESLGMFSMPEPKRVERVSDAPARRFVVPVHPEEGDDTSQGGGGVWENLVEWAEFHRLGFDQALLVCACTAAHAAGPHLHFKGCYSRRIFAPTLVTAREDGALRGAITCALDPLRSIEQELIDLCGSAGDASAAGKRRPGKQDDQCVFSRLNQLRLLYDAYEGTPWGELDPDREADGAVRFLLEGEPPANTFPFLRGCHLHTAIALLDIHRFPQTKRARENRLQAISAMLNGFRRDGAWIRGFISFSRNDFEWILEATRSLRWVSLPLEGCPVEEETFTEGDPDKVGHLRFDRLHRLAMREVLRQRFARDDHGLGRIILGEEAERHFAELRETYRLETSSVGHLAPTCWMLPDLFAWYLLRLANACEVQADEMELAEQAVIAARMVRSKVAGIYDRHAAQVLGRRRRAMAERMVKRVKRLGGICTRRELARGMDCQRMETITPLIELLVRRGVFGEKAGGLTMRDEAALGGIGLEEFVPPLEEVPHSATRRVRIVEEDRASKKLPGEPVAGSKPKTI